MDFPLNSTLCSNYKNRCFFSLSVSFLFFLVACEYCPKKAPLNVITEEANFVEKLIKIGLNALETNCDRN